MMLKPGRYKSEHDGDVFHAYRYVMEVKETSKSYVFKLLEVENLYADDHIEIMFGGKKRIVLPKDKPCRHAMRVWSSFGMKFLMERPGLFNTALKFAPVVNHLPRFMVYNGLNAWGKGRELPAFAKESFNDMWKNNKVR